ncbi:hypothetical protein BKA64DRAFT_644362 [Cadophora sp. MPI-SDFR-AT-0126]|nr:hypothetical protein BKA64DRAFT_644362 [Leotiomycetes sp. MPI-SDFR-AT-0126]
MVSEQPDTLHQRRRRDRHVSFGHLDNEPYDIPRRRYPPTPTRLPPPSYDDTFPQWKMYFTLFLVIACIIAGLQADYAFAGEDDTPVVCYFGSWSNLEKCSYSIGDVEDNGDVLDESGKVLTMEDVFEKGVRFVDHIEELVGLTEQPHLWDHSHIGLFTFTVVASTLDLRLNKVVKPHPPHSIWSGPHSVWREWLNRFGTHYLILYRRLYDHLWLVQLAKHAKLWSSEQIESFQTILKWEALKPAEIEKRVRSGMVASDFIRLSTLREEASEILDNTNAMLGQVDKLRSCLNMLAHPAEVSLDSEGLVSTSDAMLLSDPKYWWKQLKPYFKRKEYAHVKDVASYFSGLLRAEKILEAMKKPEQELVAVLSEFEGGLMWKKLLSAKGKATREMVEEWLSVLIGIVARLEEIQSRLQALEKAAEGKKPLSTGKVIRELLQKWLPI